MGQKVNPTIFQLNRTNIWDSRYIEKKSKDFYLHTVKDLEIKKFIINFLKKNGLNVHKCKINYSNNNLNIFITYKQNLNSIPVINDINKNQSIKLTNNFIYEKNTNLKNSNNILKSIKNYFNYENINYKKKLLEKKRKKEHFSTKSLKIKRIKIIKYYKKYLNLKRNKNINNIKINNFFNNLFESITLFYNKLFKITLIIQPFNNNIIKIINKKKHALLQEKLVSLKKYQRNEFFKEGVNLMFMCVMNKKSAYLLSEYISINLKKLKKHNFFLKFIQTTLTMFEKSFSSEIKGIKIKIKGRINRRPRAKSRIIEIGHIPVITLNSYIDYSETTAYTSNGTIGVKVWICEKYKNTGGKIKYV